MNPTALCGINLTTCYAFQRKKYFCHRCMIYAESKQHHFSICKIANCEYLRHNKNAFCKEREKFTCAQLKQLDKRYRLKCNTSHFKDLRRYMNYRFKCLPLKGRSPLELYEF